MTLGLTLQSTYLTDVLCSTGPLTGGVALNEQLAAGRSLSSYTPIDGQPRDDDRARELKYDVDGSTYKRFCHKTSVPRRRVPAGDQVSNFVILSRHLTAQDLCA